MMTVFLFGRTEAGQNRQQAADDLLKGFIIFRLTVGENDSDLGQDSFGQLLSG